MFVMQCMVFHTMWRRRCQHFDYCRHGTFHAHLFIHMYPMARLLHHVR